MADTVETTIPRITADSTTPHAVTLHAHGEFDVDNCDHIATAVRAALAADRRTLTLDLRHVSFIDAATVRTLLACRTLAADAGATMNITNGTGVVARVLDLTGLSVLAGARPTATPDESARSATRCRAQPAPATTAAEVVASSALLIHRARTLMAETRRIRAMLNSRRSVTAPLSPARVSDAWATLRIEAGPLSVVYRHCHGRERQRD